MKRLSKWRKSSHSIWGKHKKTEIMEVKENDELNRGKKYRQISVSYKTKCTKRKLKMKRKIYIYNIGRKQNTRQKKNQENKEEQRLFSRSFRGRTSPAELITGVRAINFPETKWSPISQVSFEGPLDMLKLSRKPDLLRSLCWLAPATLRERNDGARESEKGRMPHTRERRNGGHSWHKRNEEWNGWETEGKREDGRKEEGSKTRKTKIRKSSRDYNKVIKRGGG